MSQEQYITNEPRGSDARRALANATEESRPMSASMTQLAESVGDLDTSVRQLAARVSPLIPGGNPFDQPQKEPPGVGTASVTPMRSGMVSELQARVYQLRQIMNTIQGMARNIEV